MNNPGRSQLGVMEFLCCCPAPTAIPPGALGAALILQEQDWLLSPNNRRNSLKIAWTGTSWRLNGNFLLLMWQLLLWVEFGMET